MKKTLLLGKLFLSNLYSYFHQGWCLGLMVPYLKTSLTLLKKQLNAYHQSIYNIRTGITSIDDERVQKLAKTTKGLQSLLPANPKFSYSILIIAENESKFLNIALQAAQKQSATNVEILVGVCHHELEKKIINNHQNVRVFVFPTTDDKITMLNHLVEKSSGHYLFILNQSDWIRPDLLFRFEQVLRLISHPEKTILYCDENQINNNNQLLPLSIKRKKTFHFPYFFDFVSENGFLYPKSLWQNAGGLRSEFKGAEFEDLLLRLETQGVYFLHIPLALYAERQESDKTKSIYQFKQALSEHSIAKNLNWNIVQGYRKNDIKVEPSAPVNSVQVIIPYKDQKALTMKCIRSLLKQENVNIHITAIDNRSEDKTISEEIRKYGGEVLYIDEPFNFSRLNNLAVQNTVTAKHCDAILFLNNDVELEPNAVSEMVRWVNQPRIGMVGCRLHYPDGRLQHGGIELDETNKNHMRWEHIEKFLEFEEMDRTKKILIVDAVTAACSLMKREIFLRVGGFDEVCYPIGYSDTNLAIKLKREGLLCLYTPFAKGVHHESVSRKETVEDFEQSWWLHELVGELKTR